MTRGPQGLRPSAGPAACSHREAAPRTMRFSRLAARPAWPRRCGARAEGTRTAARSRRPPPARPAARSAPMIAVSSSAAWSGGMTSRGTPPRRPGRPSVTCWSPGPRIRGSPAAAGGPAPRRQRCPAPRGCAGRPAAPGTCGRARRCPRGCRLRPPRVRGGNPPGPLPGPVPARVRPAEVGVQLPVGELAPDPVRDMDRERRLPDAGLARQADDRQRGLGLPTAAAIRRVTWSTCSARPVKSRMSGGRCSSERPASRRSRQPGQPRMYRRTPVSGTARALRMAAAGA